MSDTPDWPNVVKPHADWTTEMLTSLPAALRDAIRSDERMRPRLVQRLLTALGLQEPRVGHLVGIDSQILAAFLMYPDRVTDLAGLIWHGRLISGAITREDVEPLLSGFDEDDLVLAARLMLFAPDGTAQGYQPGNLTQTIRMSGARCILSWAKSIGGDAGRLVEIMLPKDAAVCESELPRYASAAAIILPAIVKNLFDSSERQAA